jgi:hypothetical protein
LWSPTVIRVYRGFTKVGSIVNRLILVVEPQLAIHLMLLKWWY